MTEFIKATIEKKDDGSFIAIASTNSVDRHGEVVDNNGWDLKAFKKNPVILWGHDHTEPAIGISKKTWVEGTGKKAKLMIQPILHDVTDRARAIKTLVEMGVIKTLSVGFKPLESPDGITFTKNELLEVSMVNVPANADAMTLAYKSLKDNGFENDVIKDVGIPVELLEKIDEVVDKSEKMEQDIEELRTMVKVSGTAPSKKHTEERLSMLKVVANATDKLLEADKKKAEIDQKKLIKVIKRANEILIVKEKDKLNGKNRGVA